MIVILLHRCALSLYKILFSTTKLVDTYLKTLGPKLFTIFVNVQFYTLPAHQSAQLWAPRPAPIRIQVRNHSRKLSNFEACFPLFIIRWLFLPFSSLAFDHFLLPLLTLPPIANGKCFRRFSYKTERKPRTSFGGHWILSVAFHDMDGPLPLPCFLFQSCTQMPPVAMPSLRRDPYKETRVRQMHCG